MGISIWQLLIIIAIVVLLFGTKKLRSLGSDLGESVKGFKKAMNDEAAPKQLEEQPGQPSETNKQSVKDQEPR